MTRLLAGYRSLGRGLALLLAFCAATLVTAGAVVTPLWLLATQRTGLFNAVVLGVTAVALGLAAGLRLRSAARDSGWPAALVAGVVLPLAKLACVVAAGAALLAAVGIWTQGQPVLAIAVAALAIALIGVRAGLFPARPLEQR